MNHYMFDKHVQCGTLLHHAMYYIAVFKTNAYKQTHMYLMPCQPRVTVTSCLVYKVISDLESI